MDYRSSVSEEKRLQEAQKVLAKFSGRIPVIVEINPSQIKTGMLKDIDKKKFLVPKDLSMGQFMAIIRKRMKLEPSFALFAYVNNNLVGTSMLMSQIYEDHKSSDLFLYFLISTESVFG